MIAISAAITERIVRMVQMKPTVQVSASHLPNEIDIDGRNLDGRNVKTYIFFFSFQSCARMMSLCVVMK